jgi:hypothetical protein
MEKSAYDMLFDLNETHPFRNSNNVLNPFEPAEKFMLDKERYDYHTAMKLMKRRVRVSRILAMRRDAWTVLSKFITVFPGKMPIKLRDGFVNVNIGAVEFNRTMGIYLKYHPTKEDINAKDWVIFEPERLIVKKLVKDKKRKPSYPEYKMKYNWREKIYERYRRNHNKARKNSSDY